MKRLIIRGKHIVPASQILFAGNDRYQSHQYVRWPELEVTVQDDGRYAVWVNLIDDAELLQDTRRDQNAVIKKLEPYVDEVLID